MELVEALQPLEQDDWTHFNKLHTAVLDEADLFFKKKRRKAAGKKGQRKKGA